MKKGGRFGTVVTASQSTKSFVISGATWMWRSRFHELFNTGGMYAKEG